MILSHQICSSRLIITTHGGAETEFKIDPQMEPSIRADIESQFNSVLHQ